MGGRGNGGARNNSPAPASTKENSYGFEVENTNSPVVEFTDSFWEKMAELRGYGAFKDSDLSRLVDEKMYELGENADGDALTMFSRIQEEGITDDEYWAGYHAMADWLGIKQPRYTVLDEGGSAWDEKYSSVESAEAWANERDEAKYIYDTWTRKMKKIGGKNWRS